MARRPTDRQRLEALLAVQERAIREAFLAAFDRVAASVDRRAVLAALEAGNAVAALDLLQVRTDLLAPLAEAIRGAYVAGGSMIGAGIPPSRAVVGFDGRHPRAERWVRDNAAALVTEIAADQRAAIRAVLLGQLEAGRNPRAIITNLVGRVTPQGRQGGIIGLTSQQAGWVENARQQLEALDPGYFQRARRDARFDGLVRRAIRDGQPLSRLDMDRITRRYQERLLAYRAEVVSRTESISALRAGRHEGIEQGIESGAFRRDQVRVRWSATMDARTRDTHQAMNGQEVKMGAAFTFPSGAQALFPGDGSLGAPASDTVQCRCIAAYAVNWLAG